MINLSSASRYARRELPIYIFGLELGLKSRLEVVTLVEVTEYTLANLNTIQNIKD